MESHLLSDGNRSRMGSPFRGILNSTRFNMSPFGLFRMQCGSSGRETKTVPEKNRHGRRKQPCKRRNKVLHPPIGNPYVTPVHDSQRLYHNSLLFSKPPLDAFQCAFTPKYSQPGGAASPLPMYHRPTREGQRPRCPCLAAQHGRGSVPVAHVSPPNAGGAASPLPASALPQPHPKTAENTQNQAIRKNSTIPQSNFYYSWGPSPEFQLANFMGKVFTHFSKPTRRFIEECIYGIQASGDTKLSSIVRTIDDDINPIYTEKRLGSNLNNDKFSLLLMTDMQLHASDLLPKMRILFGAILSLLM